MKEKGWRPGLERQVGELPLVAGTDAAADDEVVYVGRRRRRRAVALGPEGGPSQRGRLRRRELRQVRRPRTAEAIVGRHGAIGHIL